MVGTFAFIAALLAVAPSHQSADYVFTSFNHPGAFCMRASESTQQGRPGASMRQATSARARPKHMPDWRHSSPSPLHSPLADKGIASNFLIFLLGLLMSQFTLTG